MARARFGTGELTRALSSSPQPVYLLNSQRILVFANEACAAWLGVATEKLLGQRCDYHSPDVANDENCLVAGLCPPPEAFLIGHSRGVVSAVRDGQPEARQASFLALSLADELAPALLVVVGTATEDVGAGGFVNSVSHEPSAQQLHVLLRWLRQSMTGRPALHRWVGESPQVKRVRELFAAASASQVRTVVIGPAGSGRREFARGIHYRPHAEQLAPFVTIDCSTVDAESLQMAVTSLVRHRHHAPHSPAALLLVEVDRLSPDAQRELRGFLELPSFDVRTLATARQSLLRLADQGNYDRSLAFALSTLEIELPFLRQRIDDLPLIVQTLIEELNAAGGKQISGMTPEALERLAVYSWPGDMAQLAGVIKEAWTVAPGPSITLADLPSWLKAAEDAAARPARTAQAIVLDEFLAKVERELLVRALARVQGNKAKAARLLGISRPRLLRRMEQLGLSTAENSAPLDSAGNP